MALYRSLCFIKGFLKVSWPEPTNQTPSFKPQVGNAAFEEGRHFLISSSKAEGFTFGLLFFQIQFLLFFLLTTFSVGINPQDHKFQNGKSFSSSYYLFNCKRSNIFDIPVMYKPNEVVVFWGCEATLESSFFRKLRNNYIFTWEMGTCCRTGFRALNVILTFDITSMATFSEILG